MHEFAFGSREHTELSKYLENAFKERYKERPHIREQMSGPEIS